MENKDVRKEKKIDKRLAIFLLAVIAIGLFGCVLVIARLSFVITEQSELTEIHETRTKEEIISLRNMHSVEVLDWELSGQLVNDDPYKRYDIVYLRITNHSTEQLPSITLKTTRYNAAGERQGWSRAPDLYLGGLKPGETREYTYKPLGSFYDPDFISIVGSEAVTTRITVEIEPFVEDEDMRFFAEMEHLLSQSTQ